MVKLIIIKKSGSVKSTNIKLSSLELLYKKCGFSNVNNFCKRHTWKMENMFYSLYSKNNGNAGSENKFDLPPPIDEDLYFGNMILLKHENEEIQVENLKDCNKDEFEKLYNYLFGGFEDIEDSEEEEEEVVDPENLTKDGYDKSDGFVVDDEDVEFEDIDSIDSNDIIISDEYDSDESDESNESNESNEVDKMKEYDSESDESESDEYESDEYDPEDKSLKEEKFHSEEESEEESDEESEEESEEEKEKENKKDDDDEESDEEDEEDEDDEEDDEDDEDDEEDEDDEDDDEEDDEEESEEDDE